MFPREMNKISLGTYQFDPLYDLDDFNVNVLNNDSPNYYIVQFNKSLNRTEQKEMKDRYGLRLKDYLPNTAYVELLDGKIVTKLKDNILVRVVVLFQTAFIRSQRSLQVDSGLDANERKRIELFAILFPNSNLELVMNSFESLGIKVSDMRSSCSENGDCRIAFTLLENNDFSKIYEVKEVCSICYRENMELDNGTTSGIIQSGIPGITPIWAKGIHGENQIIGIIDEEMDIMHCFFMDLPGRAPPCSSHRKVVGYRCNPMSRLISNFHGTFVAGIAAGDDYNTLGSHPNKGIAYNAKITFTDRKIVDQRFESTRIFSRLRSAMNDGAFIHSNSWHEKIDPPKEQYSSISYDVDRFVWENEENLVIASSSDSDSRLGPPGSSKNCLCVSASKQYPLHMDYGDGSSGPTQDGRRKPEIMAPGCSIYSSKPNTPCEVSPSIECASSWATPAVAGAAALVRQYYTEGFYPTGGRISSDCFVPTGALLKATLLNGTIDMTGIPGYPNDTEGWGLIKLDNVLVFAGSSRKLQIWDIKHTDGLCTGEVHAYSSSISTSAIPLKITMVYNDPPPANANVSHPVVNNLDLKVTSPSGLVYLGNVISGGVSQTGGSADCLNNVEMVIIPAPSIGLWSIEVLGTSVNVGSPGQGYALVVTGDLVL